MRDALAQRLVNDEEAAHWTRSGSSVVLDHLVMPANRVPDLWPLELVVLAQDPKTAVAALGQLCYLRNRKAPVADGRPTAQPVRVNLDVSDIGHLADRPAALAQQCRDRLQRRIAQHGLRALTAADVEQVAVKDEQDPVTTSQCTGRCERRRSQRPVAILGPGVGDGATDVEVSHAAAEQLVDCHGFSGVLEAVDARHARRSGRAYVASARPLADAFAGDAEELADLTGQIPASRPVGRSIGGHGSGPPGRPASIPPTACG